MTRDFEINPDDLEPAIDIELGRQKKILRLVDLAEYADHYQLLGLPSSAEKKEIKEAYFTLMNELHPDKFYGKNLGGFAPRLTRLIEALTKANDVLGRKKTRAEYDHYLASRQGTIGARTSVLPRSPSSVPGDRRDSTAPRGTMPPAGEDSDRSPSPSSPPARRQRAAVAPIDVFPTIPKAPKAPQIEGLDQLAEAEPSAPPESDGSASPASTSSLPPTSPRADTGSPRTPRSDAARRLLARKMGRRPAATAPRTTSRPPPPNEEAVKSAVRADLRARYDLKHGRSPAQAAKYQRLGEEAFANRDWASAVNSLRMAAAAAPDDKALEARLAFVQLSADRELAPKFIEQAKYEEKDGRPERAARSYERAAAGMGSADLFNKGAACLLKARVQEPEDQRKAVELARQAVNLDNRNVAYRLTLARAYDAAGMRTSAQGEARRALELEPNNDEAKQLAKALR